MRASVNSEPDEVWQRMPHRQADAVYPEAEGPSFVGETGLFETGQPDGTVVRVVVAAVEAGLQGRQRKGWIQPPGRVDGRSRLVTSVKLGEHGGPHQVVEDLPRTGGDHGAHRVGCLPRLVIPLQMVENMRLVEEHVLQERISRAQTDRGFDLGQRPLLVPEPVERMGELQPYEGAVGIERDGPLKI